MATATKKPEDGMVEVFVPKAGVGQERDLFISINGKNWLLPKGKTSVVPDFVAAEYYRSLKAQARFEDRKDQLIEQKS